MEELLELVIVKNNVIGKLEAEIEQVKVELVKKDSEILSLNELLILNPVKPKRKALKKKPEVLREANRDINVNVSVLDAVIDAAAVNREVYDDSAADESEVEEENINESVAVENLVISAPSDRAGGAEAPPNPPAEAGLVGTPVNTTVVEEEEEPEDPDVVTGDEEDDDDADEESVRSGAAEFPCELCGINIGDEDQLGGHLESCHLLCDVCNNFCRDKAALDKHMVHAHPNQVCMLCMDLSIVNGFKTVEMLAIHLQNFHYRCGVCGSWCHNLNVLNDHVIRVHPKFQCNFCSEQFQDKSLLDNHMNLHLQNDSIFGS